MNKKENIKCEVSIFADIAKLISEHCRKRLQEENSNDYILIATTPSLLNEIIEIGYNFEKLIDKTCEFNKKKK